MVDDRSPSAKAMAVVSQITSITLMAILPLLGGLGLDNWLETKPLFILLGGAFGFMAAGFQLTRMVKQLEAESKSKP